MTQPNQSELRETILSILGITDRTSGNRPEQIATLEQELNAYITANYTPNTEVAKREQSLWAITYDFLHGVDRGLCDEWERAIKGGEIV